jgi:AcrR family transcriptional regulator
VEDTTLGLDPRVRRTRAALRSALLELARAQPLPQLSVAAVAALAGVTRPTFYDHYRDLDELTLDALRVELQQLRDITRDAGELVSGGADPDAPPPGLLRLAGFLDERRTLLAQALGPDGSAAFAAWLRQGMAADVREALEARPELVRPDVPSDLQADIVVGALLGAFVPRLAVRPRPDPAEVADRTWRLLRSLLGPDPEVIP